MLHPQLVLFATYWWDCSKRAIAQTAKSWDLLVVLLAIVGSSFFGSLTGYEVTIHQPLELALVFFLILLCIRILFVVPFQKWQSGVRTIESLEASRTTQRAVDELAELLSEGISKIWNSYPKNEPEMQKVIVAERDWLAKLDTLLSNKFNVAEKLHIMWLGVVPLAGRKDAYDQRHEKMLREYALREQRIRQVIERKSNW